MGNAKIIVAIYDTTSYAVLSQLARELSHDNEVEYLIALRPPPRTNPTEANNYPHKKLRPANYVNEFIDYGLFEGLNESPPPRSNFTEITNGLIEDWFRPKLSYDIEGYLDESRPDAFICAHDQLPFIKHVIKGCHSRGIPSVVVQHGMNHPALTSSDDGFSTILKPTLKPKIEKIEYLKRAIGYQFGPYLFTNPYLDEVYTFGDFFTDYLRDLRSTYPSFGKTKVVTTGPLEFNPTAFSEYDPHIDNVLFLSQWQLDGGHWGQEKQEWIVNRLSLLEKNNDVKVTVRPHPRESTEKIERYFSKFNVSANTSLDGDIRNHDFVLTYDSTAIMHAVLAGKACGIIRFPDENLTFPPLNDDFLISVSNDEIDLTFEAANRTGEDQLDYLRKFCYVPSLDNESGYESPRSIIKERIHTLIE